MCLRVCRTRNFETTIFVSNLVGSRLVAIDCTWGLVMAQPSLAEMLDADVVMRQIGRNKGCLTMWDDPTVVGLANCGHLKLNLKLMEITTDWFLPQSQGPQAIPIDAIRKQAWVRESTYTGKQTLGRIGLPMFTSPE